ncbi:MAG: tail fiber domain-containing protein, partial [Candidatus Competibacteraceae bacterium]|nr:tail fiber domain-containing protein [Candidatus Competibacteraceae bacterium]
MNMFSDRTAKQGITRVATLPQGIGLYLFDYRPELRDLAGHGRQLGVMADEVEGVMPDAVSLHPAGYKMVNYALLGIRSPDVAWTLADASL